jgi:hypothetical protein
MADFFNNIQKNTEMTTQQVNGNMIDDDSLGSIFCYVTRFDDLESIMLVNRRWYDAMFRNSELVWRDCYIDMCGFRSEEYSSEASYYKLCVFKHYLSRVRKKDIQTLKILFKCHLMTQFEYQQWKHTVRNNLILHKYTTSPVQETTEYELLIFVPAGLVRLSIEHMKDQDYDSADCYRISFSENDFDGSSSEVFTVWENWDIHVNNAERLAKLLLLDQYETSPIKLMLKCLFKSLSLDIQDVKRVLHENYL